MSPAPESGPTFDDIAGASAVLVPALIAVILILVLVIFLIAWISGRDVDLGYKDYHLRVGMPRPGGGNPQAEGDLVKYQAAMEVYSDLSQALIALIEAESVTDAGRRARDWFQRFSTALGHALTLGSRETYRVTVWLDDPAKGELRAIGQHLTTTPRLPRQPGIVAAHVVTQEREYYCRDNRDDPIYVARDGRPKDYRSVFCVPIGPEGEVWGSITVDAKAADGFSETDKDIVRSFAGLAAAGGAAWVVERAEQQRGTRR